MERVRRVGVWVIASLFAAAPAWADEPTDAAADQPPPANAAIPPEPPPGVEPAPGAPADPSTNEADKRVGVGIDAFVVLPVGNFADATGVLGGPVTRFGYRVVPAFELSLRVGYLFAISKDQGGGVVSKVDLLPVWLEARLFVTSAYQGLYLALAGGMNLYLPTITPPIPGPAGDKVTELRRRFGANFGVGYVLSASLPIDVRLQVIAPNLVGRDDALKEKTDIGVSLSGGYTLQF